MLTQHSPTKQNKKTKRYKLLYKLSFLPSKVLASALSALSRGCGVSGSAVSADFHVQPVLLRYGFFNWI